MFFKITFESFSDSVVQKMQQNNVFTIAKRNVEGQDMLYQSLKLTNNVWVLAEIKIPPGGSVYTVKTPINVIIIYIDIKLTYCFNLFITVEH